MSFNIHSELLPNSHNIAERVKKALNGTPKFVLALRNVIKRIKGKTENTGPNYGTPVTEHAYENSGLLSKTQDMDTAKQQAIDSKKKRLPSQGGAQIQNQQGQVYLG